LTVYPNPTSNSDVLKIKSQATGQGRIINLQGQVLETFQVLQNNWTTDVQINNLPKGIYTLLFEEVSGNISTEKIIIQ
jgi:ABC-type long-subunit fatty acid transport system fused permease/ATPase subunit